MQKRAVAFTGPSGSGKTTTIEKIAKKLTQDRKVVIIKHDPSDKAKFDTDGKDSHKFFNTGADVAVVSPTRTTLFSHTNREVVEIAEMFGDFDLLIVEGLKYLPLPRIGIFRGEIIESYLPVVKALAIDHAIDLNKYKISEDIKILDLNDIDAIITWIDQNSVEI